jgi:hypothetical protein
MSRTYRRLRPRKQHKRGICRFEQDYKLRNEREHAKYYSDCGHKDFAFENSFEIPFLEAEASYRAWFRKELHRWLKDPEREVIARKRKKIWDYC